MKGIQLIAEAILDSFSVGSVGRQTSSKSRVPRVDHLSIILSRTWLFWEVLESPQLYSSSHAKAQGERLPLLGPNSSNRPVNLDCLNHNSR